MAKRLNVPLPLLEHCHGLLRATGGRTAAVG